jgi:hypothetical protein
MTKIAFALATILALAFASPVFAAIDSGHDPDVNVQQQIQKDYWYLQNGGD